MESGDSASPAEEALSRIYWDTMIFVYLVEDHPVFGSKINRLYRRMLERGDTLCTSTLTLGEAMVGSIKAEDSELSERIRTVLNSDEVELLPFRARTAEIYAGLRANLPVKSPDAIHLATAAEAKADVFLTNDKHLHHLVVPGIQFIAGLDGRFL